MNLSDSLNHVLSYKPVPTAKLDSKSSFITGRIAQVQGVKMGLVFRKSLTLGIGYNWLKTEFLQPIHHGDSMMDALIKLRYIAPYAEYTFYRKGPWEATVPLQIGFGKSFLQYAVDGKKNKVSSGNVIMYEPSMTIEYKVFNLIGFGGGIGYRLMLKNNRELNQQFTSPVYLIRVRLLFDEIYRIGKKKYDEME